MDEVVKKIASLGLPGVILVVTMAASGGVGGSFAVIGALAGLGGPFGILGGVGLLGIMTVLGDVIAGYGIEAVLKAVYAERSKTEPLRLLLKEIKDLPITEELKLKLRNELSPQGIPYSEPFEEPRTVEIMDE